VEGATRDFVFIDDLVERVVRFEKAGTYNVRTGREVDIKIIPYLIGAQLGIEPQVKLIPQPEDDVAHYDLDGVPNPGTRFEKGLEQTVEWYEQNGVGETFTHLKALSG
jgi:nucleoside-diphosphate-sugar epimerase